MFFYCVESPLRMTEGKIIISEIELEHVNEAKEIDTFPFLFWFRSVKRSIINPRRVQCHLKSVIIKFLRNFYEKNEYGGISKRKLGIFNFTFRSNRSFALSEVEHNNSAITLAYQIYATAGLKVVLLYFEQMSNFTSKMIHFRHRIPPIINHQKLTIKHVLP